MHHIIKVLWRTFRDFIQLLIKTDNMFFPFVIAAEGGAVIFLNYFQIYLNIGFSNP